MIIQEFNAGGTEDYKNKRDRLREANSNDLHGLLKLYTQLHDNPLPEESAELLEIWAKIIEDGNYHIVVAEEDGQIVSSCTVIIVLNLTHSQRPYAFIENVITDALFRGRGFATACLDYAKEIAVHKNCYKIMLMTGSKEESVCNFYKRAGFNSEDKTAFIQWL